MWGAVAATAFAPMSGDSQIPQNSPHPSTPEVTRQAIAGLWRLTPQPTYPLKEFTVHPQRSSNTESSFSMSASSTKGRRSDDLLLMLNEDGSFQRYKDALPSDDDEDDDTTDDEPVDVNEQWNKFQQKQQQNRKSEEEGEEDDDSLALANQLAKGVWDYRDGKLILAADRPQDVVQKGKQANGIANGEAGRGGGRHSKPLRALDKLIVGRVVASTTKSTIKRPQRQVLQSPKSNEGAQSSSSSPGASKSQADGQLTTSSNETLAEAPSSSAQETPSHMLSVPKGSLKMGKFFYPKNHPSFFEQPIYNPTTAEPRFQLKQVLGSLKQQFGDGQEQQPGWTGKPLFERSDFYNRTFLLTSHPLRQPKKTKPRRVDSASSSFLFKKKENKRVNPYEESAHIRVMQVRFFPNNTFSTVWGTGDTILRGKFDTFVRDSLGDIGGQQPNVALWMQIMRFGFGRSVSGSVYSEGRTLTQDDAKTYWGTIRRVNVTVLGPDGSEEDQARDEDGSDLKAALKNDKPIYEDVVKEEASTTEKGDGNDDSGNNTVSILEVEGSVLFGTGVGAEPVGRFLMREMMQELENEDDDDDDDDDISSLTFPKFSSSFDGGGSGVPNDDTNHGSIDGVDWSSYGSGQDAFQ